MSRPQAPPGMEFFSVSRPPQGGRSISVRYGSIEMAIHGLGEELHGSLLRRLGPFASESAGEEPSLRCTLHLAEEDYFIAPPERAERNPILQACDGSRVRYLGYRLAGWFDTVAGEGMIVLSRGDYEADEPAITNFLIAATAWTAAESGGALVHATGVVRRDRGFVFYGPSGVGKSTAARNAGVGRVIGDDISLLLPGAAGGLDLLGTPFRGSFGDTEPVVGAFPLAAAFRLVQAERNEVVEVSGTLAIGELIGNLPYIADSLETRPDLFETIERSFRDTPLRHLHLVKEGGYWEAIAAAGLLPREDER